MIDKDVIAGKIESEGGIYEALCLYGLKTEDHIIDRLVDIINDAIYDIDVRLEELGIIYEEE